VKVGRLAGPAWRSVPVVAGAAVLAVQIVLWLPVHWSRTGAVSDLDVTVYYHAAQRMAAGGSPYAPTDRVLTEPPRAFLYPPPAAAALYPLRHLSRFGFQRAVYITLLIASWVYAAALARIAWGRVTVGRVLAMGAAVALCPGTRVTLSFGNLDLVVWALVAVGMSGARALPLMAVGACLKIYPAFPLGVALARGRPRLAPTVAVLAAIAAATLATVGARAFTAWAELAWPDLGRGALIVYNVSLSMGLVRLGALAGLYDLSTGVVPTGARVFLGLAPIMGAALAAYAARRRPLRAQQAWVLIAAVWLSPICWWHYAPILLIPAAVWLSGRLAPAADTRGPAP
jgi:hypothetical protein